MKKMICFMVVSVLLWIGGYAAYVAMYQKVEFSIQTIQGDEAILQKIGIQLQFQSNHSYVSALIQDQHSSYDISNHREESFVNQVYENNVYDEKDAKEWTSAQNQVDGCETRRRIIDAVQVNYDILFEEDDTSYFLKTGLIDESGEEYSLIETASFCGNDHEIVDGIQRIDASGNLIYLDLYQLLASYDRQNYYFVPYTTSKMKGNRYLYQLTKDHGTLKQKELVSLTETQDTIGCFIIHQHILVVSQDQQQTYLTSYDINGHKTKTAMIKGTLPEGVKFINQDPYLIWETDHAMYVFDGIQMELVAQVPIDEQLLQQGLVYTVFPYYKDDILWIGSIETTSEGGEYASIQAWKDEVQRYKGRIEFMMHDQNQSDIQRPYLIQIGFQ